MNSVTQKRVLQSALSRFGTPGEPSNKGRYLDRSSSASHVPLLLFIGAMIACFYFLPQLIWR